VRAAGSDRVIARGPKVVIVGGGFAGLAAARALSAVPVAVVLVDRRNHHVFQPLLYQVATAALSAADICAPIRSVLRHQGNCEVLLSEVSAVDVNRRQLQISSGSLSYEYLVLAGGATHAYFGHDEWASEAPGLKTIDDALELRRRILLAFESAEQERDEQARRADLTFAIVGGGATGVELAGAIKEIAGRTIPNDYKRIDTRTTRVILFEAADRLLPPFAAESSARARRDLERMGVEVRVGSPVTRVTRDGIALGDEFVRARNVFWAAGVKASPLGAALGAPLDRAGRVAVGADLAIPGHPEVFVVGDMAAVTSHGRSVPGVAQAALQMGRHVGRTIAREVRGLASPAQRSAFAYRDRGSMAVIGKAKAVVEIGRLRCGGSLAWLLWGVVHIFFLIGFRNRVAVFLSWFWNWLLNARDARLITGDAQLGPANARFPELQEQRPAPASNAQRASRPRGERVSSHAVEDPVVRDAGGAR
jgi:NADH dehydrogenase